MTIDNLDRLELVIYKAVGVYSIAKVLLGVDLIIETGTQIGINFFIASVISYIYDLAYFYLYYKDQLSKITEPNLAILRYIIFFMNIIHASYTENVKLFMFNFVSLVVYSCTLANNLLEKDIPKLVFNPCNHNDIVFSDVCCICLEENVRDITKLSCSHVFHIGCIKEYAKVSNKNFCCPTCRKEVK